MARSAWNIWLHPRRSRDEMEALAEELTAVRTKLDETGLELTRVQDEMLQKSERLVTIISRADEERDSLEHRIQALEKEKVALKAEILEWEQTRIELDAIAEQLKEWEQVKNRYQEHIRMLTLRLRDARGRKGDFGGGIGEDVPSDILEDGEIPLPLQAAPIDMIATSDPDRDNAIGSDSSASRSSSAGSSVRNARSRSSSGGTQGPVIPFPTDKSTPEHRRPRPRLPKDDADWLMSLPPE
ncbi:MAG: hypothetical protein K2J15_05870 [Muribaculaceae bacterium]|nr:hypothetical protein [Muribaculaceae bacterium]